MSRMGVVSPVRSNIASPYLHLCCYRRKQELFHPVTVHQAGGQHSPALTPDKFTDPRAPVSPIKAHLPSTCTPMFLRDGRWKVAARNLVGLTRSKGDESPLSTYLYRIEKSRNAEGVIDGSSRFSKNWPPYSPRRLLRYWANRNGRASILRSNAIASTPARHPPRPTFG